MALRPESLIVNIKGQDKFSKVFEKARTSTNNLGSSLGKLKKIALGVGAAVGAMAVGIGVKAVSAASTFEKEMTNVRTLIDESTESFDDMKKGVLDLAKDMPVATSELTSALYDVRSAGTSAAKQFEVLEDSSKLAVAGLGTTKEAANLLTTAINAFGLQSRDSGEVADVLFKTVKAGKTDVAQLSQAFGKMAGNAKAANISFEDAQAATASLTALTGKTSEAQNALAQVFLELTVQGGKLDKGLKEQGSSLIQLNELIGEKGLVGGMKMAQEELGLTETEFKNLFSSAEGGTVVYQLLTDAFDKNNEALENMKEGSDELDEAFAKQTETFDAQYKMMQNNLNVAFVTLGTMILPELNKILKENIIPTIQSLTEWFDKNEESIAAVIEGIKEFMGFAGKAAGVATTPLKWMSESYIGKSVKNVLGLAEGGVVTRPTMALIGEAGPEAVVPLDKAGSLGNTFNFNFSGAFIGNVGEFKKQLMDSINRDSELKVLGGT